MAKKTTDQKASEAVIALQEKLDKAEAENEKIKFKANEIYHHVLWVAMEFGKALQDRADLIKEVEDLKNVRKR